MTRTSVTQQGSEQADDKTAIHPFQVHVRKWNWPN
jgi:hypothetical protein